MVDLTELTIHRLFERQLLQLTTKTTLAQKEDSFDVQFSRGWVR